MKKLFNYTFLVLIIGVYSCQDTHEKRLKESKVIDENKLANPSYELHFYRANDKGELDISTYKRIPEEEYYEWTIMLDDTTQRILTSEQGIEKAYINGNLVDSTYQYWKKWNSFFEFMIRIPNGIERDNNAMKEPPRDTVINNEVYKFIRVTYPESIGSDIWYYYYQGDEFKFCDFYFDENFSGGERVVFKGKQKFKEAELSKIWEWYHMPDGKFLYTDTLKYINPIGDE